MEEISRQDSIQAVTWLLFTALIQINSERATSKAIRWENIQTGEEKIAVTVQVTDKVVWKATVIVKGISTIKEKRYAVDGTFFGLPTSSQIKTRRFINYECLALA